MTPRVHRAGDIRAASSCPPIGGPRSSPQRAATTPSPIPSFLGVTAHRCQKGTHREHRRPVRPHHRRARRRAASPAPRVLTRLAGGASCRPAPSCSRRASSAARSRPATTAPATWSPSAATPGSPSSPPSSCTTATCSSAWAPLALPLLVRGRRGWLPTLIGALLSALALFGTSGALFSDWMHMELARNRARWSRP